MTPPPPSSVPSNKKRRPLSHFIHKSRKRRRAQSKANENATASGAKSPPPAAEVNTPTATPTAAAAPPPPSNEPPEPKPDIWECPSCTLHNPVSKRRCSVCGGRRPVENDALSLSLGSPCSSSLTPSKKTPRSNASANSSSKKQTQQARKRSRSSPASSKTSRSTASEQQHPINDSMAETTEKNDERTKEGIESNGDKKKDDTSVPKEQETEHQVAREPEKGQEEIAAPAETSAEAADLGRMERLENDNAKLRGVLRQSSESIQHAFHLLDQQQQALLQQRQMVNGMYLQMRQQNEDLLRQNEALETRFRGLRRVLEEACSSCEAIAPAATTSPVHQRVSESASANDADTPKASPSFKPASLNMAEQKESPQGEPFPVSTRQESSQQDHTSQLSRTETATLAAAALPHTSQQQDESPSQRSDANAATLATVLPQSYSKRQLSASPAAALPHTSQKQDESSSQRLDANAATLATVLPQSSSKRQLSASPAASTQTMDADHPAFLSTTTTNPANNSALLPTKISATAEGPRRITLEINQDSVAAAASDRALPPCPSKMPDSRPKNKPLTNSTNRNGPGWISNQPARQFMSEMDQATARQVPRQSAASSGNSGTTNTSTWMTARSRPAARSSSRGAADALWDDDSQHPNYRYVETVRCKAERQGLPCHDCAECRRFYQVLRNTGHEGLSQYEPMQYSRHRARFSPSNTPADFWELDFIDELRRDKNNQGDSAAPNQQPRR